MQRCLLYISFKFTILSVRLKPLKITDKNKWCHRPKAVSLVVTDTYKNKIRYWWRAWNLYFIFFSIRSLKFWTRFDRHDAVLYGWTHENGHHVSVSNRSPEITTQSNPDIERFHTRCFCQVDNRISEAVRPAGQNRRIFYQLNSRNS
jgi:hypothetical protein